MADLRTFLAELANVGVALSANPDGSLRCKSPPGVLTNERAEAIKQHKAEILVYLAAMEPPRALDQDELEAATLAWNTLKRFHLKALLAAGWRIADVMGMPFTPDRAKTVDDLPGVLALMMDGWSLVEILEDHLVFRRGIERVGRAKSGSFFGINNALE